MKSATGVRGVIGAAVVTVALVVTSLAVWSSPGGGAAPPSLEAQLAAAQAENERLQQELWSAEGKLNSTPSPRPTPTPTKTPKPTPTAKPKPKPTAEPAPPADNGPDTIVVYRDPAIEGQPAPPPPPAPAPEPAAPAPVTAPSVESILNPAQRYFGMYTTQAPYNFATFDDAAVKAGSRQSLVGYFSGWDQPFRSDAVRRSWERGLVPMLTWESRPMLAGNDQPEDPEYSLPLILSGKFDAYLTQYAKDIVKTGLPLAIRLNHEMNGTWYPWSEQKADGTSLNGNRPGDYAATWRYVHDIFEKAGANKYVMWVWAPNIVNNLASRHQGIEYTRSLYPGDEYVDIVGVSGYLRSPFRSGQTFTFDYTFGRTLEQLRAITDKPLFLAEVGATEIGGKKPEWVTDFFDAFARPENADIIGFAWFNLTVTTFSGGERVTNDWRIESRADSLAAFKDGLLDPGGNFTIIPYT
ncbi:glycoside hydrolase family 26 protein [Microbacterium sp. NPDC057407]|uniref:glycoside hydrolase family 26 protein n=1 Tax=Microbacterium sp. NPDC057407 TaxID=3346120 RepID=UPI003670B21E